MKKHLQILMLLAALLVPWATKAQDTVTIGDGTGTTYYGPFNSLWGYSFVEMIYPDSLIGTAGTITEVSFYLGQSSSAAQTNDYDVFMKNVTRGSFAGNTDFETVDSSDIVFSGTWTIPMNYTGWVTLVLDTPFQYDGTSNLMIAMHEKTSGYSTRYFSCTNAPNSLISAHSDSADPNPYDLASYTGNKYTQNIRPNVQLLIQPGGGTATTVTICDGTATNGYVPVYGFYADAYLKAHFIYPSDSLTLMNGATINQMTFYASQASVNWGSANFNVYVAETTDTTISAFADVTNMTLVYTGSLGIDSNKMVIPFTNGYTYNGGNLLVAVENVVEGSYVTSTWYGVSATGASVQGYNYNSLGGISPTQRDFLPKVTMDFTPAGALDCQRPTGLVASNVTAHGATLTWDSTASIYQFEYKKASETEWDTVALTDTTYTLTGLNQNTAYNVRVMAICNADLASAYTNASFTTPISCPDPTGLAATLTPGNGTIATLNWVENGTATAWEVEYDTASDFSTATAVNATNTTLNLTGLTAEAIYYARVRAICGVGDTSNWSAVCNFTPTNAYSITINDGTVTNGYVPVYGFYADAYLKAHYICPSTDLASMGTAALTQLTFYATQSSVNWGSANFNVYLAETTDSTISAFADVTDMTLVYSGSLGISNNMMVVPFTDEYIYMGGNLIVAVENTVEGSYVTSTWYGISAPGASVQGYSYNSLDEITPTQRDFLPKMTIEFIPTSVTCLPVRGLTASNVTSRGVTLTWTDALNTGATYTVYDMSDTSVVATGITGTTYTVTGLTPETSYTFGVVANCSATDASRLCTASATTLESCPTPSLTVDDIYAYGATAYWTGTASSYNVRYRNVFGPVLLSTSFDTSSLYGWTNIDADGDGYAWVLGSAAGGVYLPSGNSLAGTGHNNSNDLVCSGSYSNYTNAALTPDNYLVSPQVQLGGSITFWATAQDAAYPSEHFGVAVSTTGNTDTSDFTTIAEWTLTAAGTGAKDQGTWGLFTVDLSAYAGQTGYVAIRHFNCTDQFILNIDDITIYGPSPTTNDWIDTTVTGNSFVLSGLTAETDYVVQVQADCGVEDSLSSWASANFSTNDVPCFTPSRLAADYVLADRATVSWYGYASDYNVRTRTNFYSTHFNTDADRAGWTWEGYTIYGLDDPVNGYASSENYFLQMGWATTNETYIFSPELPEYASGSTMVFHYFAFNDSNTFQLGYSTTTGDTSAFTWSTPIVAVPGAYYSTQYSEVLPAGVKYIAFKATAVDQNHCIFIDNFGIVGPWQDTTVTGTSIYLTGLEPTTPYEIKVQSDCGVTDSLSGWSNSLIFTTDSVNLQAFANDTVTACNSYIWHGTNYIASTTVADTVYAPNADSIYTLVLTVNYSNTGVETVTACDSYTWHGTAYTASTNTPTYTSTNIVGCDSVTTLHLTINYSNTAIETVTACNSYVWHGTNYSASTNTPTFTTTNAAGCDSVTTLHLTIIECSTTEITACDSYTWHGNTYTVGGTYTDGTDTLVLTINHSNTGIETVTACNSYTWHGTAYTASTSTPTDTSMNVAGCDSVTTLHLTINYSTTGDTFAIACDSFAWYGTNYISSANPTRTTTNAVGCDSVTTLHLTINNSNTGIETVTACNSYVWHGTTYNASTNTPTYTSTNAAGCDSVTTLHLTIIQCSTTDITACDSYTWFGTTYTVGGTYYHGTDTLNLTLNYSTTGTETVTACDSLQWNDVWYTTSTVIIDSLQTIAGCDSIVTITLTVNHSVEIVDSVIALESYTWHDSVYTESGTYYFHTQTVAGCDSTEVLVLTIGNYYSVAIVVANTEGLLNVGGTVTGAGSYLAGTEVTLTATPDSGYLFDGWYTRSAMGFGGELITADSVYTFTLEENVVVVAMFERIGANSALLTVSVDSTMGYVLFNGERAPFNIFRGTLGETVTLEAIGMDENCEFLGWVNTMGDTISRDAVYDYVLEQTTTTLTAAFVRHEGINNVDASNVTIFARENGVVVRGAAQAEVYVFDAVGRLVGHVSAAGEEEFIRLSQTGVYLVKVANLPARRVVVRQ